jgi:hypothetical protein
VATIYSLDEYRAKYITLASVPLRENPPLAEVIGPLYPALDDDDPDDAA